MLTSLYLFLVWAIIETLNDIVMGHALLVIGIITSLLGLFLDTYQFLQ